MDDQLYNQILHLFISNENKYPGEIYKLPPEKRVNAKKSFRLTVKPYTLKDGVLMNAEKQVLRKSGVDTVPKMCHDNPVTGGHFGGDKTYQKIASRFYWKSKYLLILNLTFNPGTNFHTQWVAQYNCWHIKAYVNSLIRRC